MRGGRRDAEVSPSLVALADGAAHLRRRACIEVVVKLSRIVQPASSFFRRYRPARVARALIGGITVLEQDQILVELPLRASPDPHTHRRPHSAHRTPPYGGFLGARRIVCSRLSSIRGPSISIPVLLQGGHDPPRASRVTHRRSGCSRPVPHRSGGGRALRLVHLAATAIESLRVRGRTAQSAIAGRIGLAHADGPSSKLLNPRRLHEAARSGSSGDRACPNEVAMARIVSVTPQAANGSRSLSPGLRKCRWPRRSSCFA